MTPVCIVIVEIFSFPIQGEVDKRDKLHLAFFQALEAEQMKDSKSQGFAKTQFWYLAITVNTGASMHLVAQFICVFSKGVWNLLLCWVLR